MQIRGYRRLGRAVPRPSPPARAPAARSAARRGLIWQGPTGGIGAMPRVSQKTVAALRRRGVFVIPRRRRPGLRGVLGRSRLVSSCDVHLRWVPATFLGGFGQRALGVGYTFCESTAVGPRARERCARADLLLVPSLRSALLERDFSEFFPHQFSVVVSPPCPDGLRISAAVSRSHLASSL